MFSVGRFLHRRVRVGLGLHRLTGNRPLQIDPLRRSLLALHGAIVAVEREDYERTAGRVTSAEFMHALILDPAWAWLQPLSALIVQLDEPATLDLAAWRAEARKLLKPDSEGGAFQQRYAWLFERDPSIVVAHGAVMQALGK